ncbi:hypothetical protein C8N32_1232 [Rhodovulum imhoffii]|uniref:Uncharacterized protein n=1 Tax=Rhodovulum imhoffii TaxID=365340 RepID=A0A2T5BP01_9RHOB|nr:hypothetical protein C8N32_1232 [Rhodovulum imhoffii]
MSFQIYQFKAACEHASAENTRFLNAQLSEGVAA